MLCGKSRRPERTDDRSTDTGDAGRGMRDAELGTIKGNQPLGLGPCLQYSWRYRRRRPKPKAVAVVKAPVRGTWHTWHSGSGNLT